MSRSPTASRSYGGSSKPATDRQSAIQLQEVGISRAMVDAGYRFDSYFTPTRAERLPERLSTVPEGADHPRSDAALEAEGVPDRDDELADYEIPRVAQRGDRRFFFGVEADDSEIARRIVAEHLCRNR